MLQRKSNVMHVMILSIWKLILRHTLKASTALLHQVQLLRFHHVKVLKFLLPEDLTHMSPLHKNHLRYSLGHVTGFVQIGAAVQRRLRRIQAQVVIKATLFMIAMYLILEAINYYYYMTNLLMVLCKSPLDVLPCSPSRSESRLVWQLFNLSWSTKHWS